MIEGRLDALVARYNHAQSLARLVENKSAEIPGNPSSVVAGGGLDRVARRAKMVTLTSNLLRYMASLMMSMLRGADVVFKQQQQLLDLVVGPGRQLYDSQFSCLYIHSTHLLPREDNLQVRLGSTQRIGTGLITRRRLRSGRSRNCRHRSRTPKASPASSLRHPFADLGRDLTIVGEEATFLSLVSQRRRSRGVSESGCVSVIAKLC